MRPPRPMDDPARDVAALVHDDPMPRSYDDAHAEADKTFGPCGDPDCPTGAPTAEDPSDERAVDDVIDLNTRARR